MTITITTIGDLIEAVYGAWSEVDLPYTNKQIGFLAAWTLASLQGADDWSPFPMGEA